jgi:hypothetical protein
VKAIVDYSCVPICQCLSIRDTRTLDLAAGFALEVCDLSATLFHLLDAMLLHVLSLFHHTGYFQIAVETLRKTKILVIVVNILASYPGGPGSNLGPETRYSY